jgi:hypothetical protein
MNIFSIFILKLENYSIYLQNKIIDKTNKCNQ